MVTVMKNLNSKWLSALAFGVLLSGCEMENATSVDQERIYTSYGISYDAFEQKLRASATFYFGGPTGTYLILDGQSDVQIDGTSLQKETTFLNQVSYEKLWG